MDLYIDTHLDDIIILLFKDKKIYKQEIIKGEKQNSKLIMPLIKRILEENTPTSIIVCNGPGSFTGVRLGVTIAKTLAYLLNVPIRTISTLECLAVSLEEAKEKKVAISDKNGYYIGIFDNDINLTENYQYLSNAEYENYSKNNYVNTEIELNYEKIYEYIMKKNAVNPHVVNPIYVKKIDVEK